MVLKSPSSKKCFLYVCCIMQATGQVKSADRKRPELRKTQDEIIRLLWDFTASSHLSGLKQFILQHIFVDFRFVDRLFYCKTKSERSKKI